MTHPCFDLTIDNHIAHIRFTRPEKANSMIPEFWSGLPELVTEISDAGDARVIVLSAEGKHFTSGMDISVFMQSGGIAGEAGRERTAEHFRHHLFGLQDTFSALEKARQPVLAACQGGVIGAGVDLVTACDCRYATRDAFFCVQETAVGMTADVGTFPRLAKVIPEGWARQMSFTAERLPAEKAKEIGLVNEVYNDADALLDGVMEIAARIAKHSPLAVYGVKHMINYTRDHTTADTLDYIATWNAAMLSPSDIQSSFMAMQEKRQPEYENLLPVKKV